MILSLIVPFFNSEKKSTRLLKTLSGIDKDDIEIILIDDGSTDDTYKVLKDFKSNASNKNIEVITQDNKGPGGARNAGLAIAAGEYVWFVDSDDDITLDAIDVVRKNRDKGYDFIDFNVESATDLANTMDLASGEYTVNDEYRLQLLKKFGRIWTKVFRKDLIIKNKIFYPEYTLYEDNPLQFMYPFFIKKFLKVDIVGYIHHLEFESITRSKINSRTFDRLQTSIYGFEKGLKLAKNKEEIKVLEKMFINKYLLITTEKLLTKRPSKNWMTTWRLMKQYRKVSEIIGIESSPYDAFEITTFNSKVRSYFAIQWAASYLIVNDQTKYFDDIRERAWKVSSIKK